MNIVLWVLQVLLALHTTTGAVWKFSHSAEYTMPSFSSIPHWAWLALGLVELACALALIAPAINKSFGALVPIAAIALAVEMLLFIGIHFYSGSTGYSPIIYWGVVAAICAFMAYGRVSLKPF